MKIERAILREARGSEAGAEITVRTAVRGRRRPRRHRLRGRDRRHHAAELGLHRHDPVTRFADLAVAMGAKLMAVIATSAQYRPDLADALYRDETVGSRPRRTTRVEAETKTAIVRIELTIWRSC